MKPTRGLTLIELVVALALVSVLMTTALAAIVNLSRSEAANADRYDAAASRVNVGRIMELDLEHAAAWRAMPNGFILQTFAALEREGLDLDHRQAEITYEVRKVGTETHLLRVQRIAGEEPFTELVSPNVSSISLISSSSAPAPPGGTWLPLAARVQVTVNFQDALLGIQQFSFHTGGAP